MNENPESGLKTRQISLSVLESVLKNNETLKDTLERNPNFLMLEPRDRAFVHLLVATSLRRRGQLNALVKTYLKTPLPKKLATVQEILFLGAAQLIFLKSPAHAVVNIAVTMCRRFPGHQGLVNAVLRRIADDGASRLRGIDIRLNTPKWLWNSWINAYGEEAARAIAAIHAQEPPLDITVSGEPRYWAQTLGAKVFDDKTIRLTKVNEIKELPGYANGSWWVQDFAASLPARLLLSLVGNSGKKPSVIDLCAAPGGKTAQLLAAGALVTSVDKSNKRTLILKQNLKRLGYNIKPVIADARRFVPPRSPDAILLDAPCSATGTIRRNPDIPYTKNQSIVEKMAEIQLELATEAVNKLNSGGLLIYSVCSLQIEEGEKVIERLLKKKLGIKPIAVNQEGLFKDTLIQGDLGARTLPSDRSNLGGMDGFYMCALKRN